MSLLLVQKADNMVIGSYSISAKQLLENLEVLHVIFNFRDRNVHTYIGG